MAERFTLPPILTGSTWTNVWGALQRPPRGVVTEGGGTAPRWTDREAVSVIAGAREAARRAPGGFPLWYQFAAAAYGWAPETDQVAKTEAQADALYEPELAVLLNAELRRIFAELDTASVANPRLALDSGAWESSWTDVVRALQQDGAQATFKIPLPTCRDPKTGKPTKPVRGKDGKWSCPGGPVLIDDPLTAIAKSAAKIAVPAAVILIAAWILNEKRGTRRRRT